MDYLLDRRLPIDMEQPQDSSNHGPLLRKVEAWCDSQDIQWRQLTKREFKLLMDRTLGIHTPWTMRPEAAAARWLTKIEKREAQARNGASSEPDTGRVPRGEGVPTK